MGRLFSASEWVACGGGGETNHRRTGKFPARYPVADFNNRCRWPLRGWLPRSRLGLLPASWLYSGRARDPTRASPASVRLCLLRSEGNMEGAKGVFAGWLTDQRQAWGALSGDPRHLGIKGTILTNSHVGGLSVSVRACAPGRKRWLGKFGVPMTCTLPRPGSGGVSTPWATGASTTKMRATPLPGISHRPAPTTPPTRSPA